MKIGLAGYFGANQRVALSAARVVSGDLGVPAETGWNGSQFQVTARIEVPAGAVKGVQGDFAAIVTSHGGTCEQPA